MEIMLLIAPIVTELEKGGLVQAMKTASNALDQEKNTVLFAVLLLSTVEGKVFYMPENADNVKEQGLLNFDW